MKELNMQNSRLTTKLRLALDFQSLAFVYAFLLAGSLGAQSVYIPYTFTSLAGAASFGSADGTGSAAQFRYPNGVATDSSGTVYVADNSNHTIRQITPAGVVTTLAGQAGSFGSADGTGSAARFNYPVGVATDSSGNVYVCDNGNYTIRKITPAGVVTTLAGLAGSAGSADDTGSAARFNNPGGVATDSSSNVYVADTSNHTIRKITPAGAVTTLAGLAGSQGSADGTGSAAQFRYPSGVATDSSGNVYVADSDNYTIRKITLAGVVTTLAGLAGSYGDADGTGSAAQFRYPTGVAADSSGNVYVADIDNNTIRKISPAGVVTTLAGLAGITGSADGTGSAARFNSPGGVATDSSGNVYVADTVNNTIRKGFLPPQTTITVTSTADSGTGTLRAALASAANGDTIDASGVTGTILLTSGELLVPNNVTILGPGPANLAVDGNAASRVFHISGAAVTIAGLAITNGYASGAFPANNGGGIYNDGVFGSATLTVSNCACSGNSASQDGGGIYSYGAFGSATLTVSNCAFSGNSASRDGGGIYNDGAFGSATLTVSASTLSSNSASRYGGAIYNDGPYGSATLTVGASLLHSNSASASGGGIYNNGEASGTGAVQIVNSTLSGNLASGNGGGIYNDGLSSGKVTLLVRASTLSGNSAGGGNGSGIFNNGGGGTASVELGSTILKAGAVGANIANLSGTVSSDGYNLASDGGGGFLTGTADQINIDPMLGPLQDNGGPTFTQALLPGSPAIDKGANLSGYPTDQRGFPRMLDRPCIANAPGGDGTDIGAFEVQLPCPVAVSLGNVGVVLNQFGFAINGGSNQVVVVEASTNLVTWTALATNTLGASPLHFSEAGWTNFQQRFYRAKLVP